jgi:hypothetical protein
MGELRPGKYLIACELNPLHRALDLPSQCAHHESGLVQLITGNGSEYQKWLIEQIDPGLFTIRSNLLGGKFIEPLRSLNRDEDGILLAFYPRADSPFQHWHLEPISTENTFYIRNEATGKYWDLREQDPSHIQQLFKKDIAHQRWIFQPAR